MSDTTFDGFVPPEKNFFHMPNEWINICADIKSLAELKVVQYVLRHTWGFREYDGAPKPITTDEFMYGRKRYDESRMDKGTGLSNRSVIDGLRDAEEHGYLICVIDDSDRARVIKSYALKMITAEPDVKILHSENGCEESSQRLCTSFTSAVKNLHSDQRKTLKKDTKERHMCVSRKPPIPKKTIGVSSPPGQQHTHTSPPPGKPLEITPEGERVIEFYQKLRKKPMRTEKIIRAANTLGENDEVNEENMHIVLDELDKDPWFGKNPQAPPPDLSWVCERWEVCLTNGRKRREKENTAATSETLENDEEEILRGWQEWVGQVERGEESVGHLVETNLPAYVLAMLPEQSRAEIRENTQKRKETVICAP